jgi:hypothetical protein
MPTAPKIFLYAWPSEGGLATMWVAPPEVERDRRWMTYSVFGRYGAGYYPFGRLDSATIKANYRAACREFSKLFGVPCELRWGVVAPEAEGRVAGKLKGHLDADARDFLAITEHARSIEQDPEAPKHVRMRAKAIVRLVAALERRDKPLSKRVGKGQRTR